MKKRIKDLEQQLRDAKSNMPEDMDEIKIGYDIELEQKDARISALEKEQIKAATQFAQEIAELKTELMRALANAREDSSMVS